MFLVVVEVAFVACSAALPVEGFVAYLVVQVVFALPADLAVDMLLVVVVDILVGLQVVRVVCSAELLAELEDWVDRKVEATDLLV